MSTTTVTFDHASTTETAPTKGLLHWLIKARERQGEAQVRAVFARMSDRQLSDLGFNPDQVRQVRQTGTIPASYWA